MLNSSNVRRAIAVAISFVLAAGLLSGCFMVLGHIYRSLPPPAPAHNPGTHPPIGLFK